MKLRKKAKIKSNSANKTSVLSEVKVSVRDDSFVKNDFNKSESWQSVKPKITNDHPAKPLLRSPQTTHKSNITQPDNISRGTRTGFFRSATEPM